MAGTKRVNGRGKLAVTADDRYLLTADTKHGVRVYDLANGDLINRMEGHALEGDAYYDARAGIFVTTGDGTIKVWDIAHQTLLKRIQQGFHSQFMKNVYIDTKQEFIFAEGVKYRFDTGKTVKRYKSTADPASHYRYFFQDRYYLLDEKTGRITAYDCFDDKLLTSYTLKEYRQGTDLYFDDRSGRLFT